MTQGTLIAFLYLLDAVARAAGDIGGIATMRARRRSRRRKRIFDEVLDVEPEVKEKPDAMVMPHAGRACPL